MFHILYVVTYAMATSMQHWLLAFVILYLSAVV